MDSQDNDVDDNGFVGTKDKVGGFKGTTLEMPPKDTLSSSKSRSLGLGSPLARISSAPRLQRTASGRGNLEADRQALADMIEQIR